MIEFRQKGDFSKVTSFLERATEMFNLGILDKYGRQGVEALRSATPKDTGLTADSWSYSIEHSKGTAKLVFTNSNMTVMNIPVAILIQYGHGTRNGGFVEGIDYINPALEPIFTALANEAWREVTR